MNKLIGIVLTIIFLILVFSNVLTPEVELKVKSGEWQLECLISNGWRIIPAEKIVGISDSGRWLFVNGSAGTCEVIK